MFKSPLGHEPFAYITWLRACRRAHELLFWVVGEPQSELAVGGCWAASGALKSGGLEVNQILRWTGHKWAVAG